MTSCGCAARCAATAVPRRHDAPQRLGGCASGGRAAPGGRIAARKDGAIPPIRRHSRVIPELFTGRTFLRVLNLRVACGTLPLNKCEAARVQESCGK